MSTALQLNQIIGQLTDENIALVELYAEFLLYRQHEKPLQNGKGKNEAGDLAIERLKRLRKHAGKAKYPDTPTDKYSVYEQ